MGHADSVGLTALLSNGGAWSPCVAGLNIMSTKPPGWTAEVVELYVSLGSSCTGVGGVRCEGMGAVEIAGIPGHPRGRSGFQPGKSH